MPSRGRRRAPELHEEQGIGLGDDDEGEGVRKKPVMSMRKRRTNNSWRKLHASFA